MSYQLFDDLPDILDARQIASALRISRASAYNLLSSADFPTLHIGKRKLVMKADLIQWLKSHTNTKGTRTMRGNSNDGRHKRHDIIPTFPESEEFMENTAFGFSRKIGTTLYRANIHYTPQGTESFEEKLMRLIRHDALDIFGSYGIMKVPQASRQSERSHYGYQAG